MESYKLKFDCSTFCPYFRISYIVHGTWVKSRSEMHRAQGTYH